MPRMWLMGYPSAASGTIAHKFEWCWEATVQYDQTARPDRGSCLSRERKPGRTAVQKLSSRRMLMRCIITAWRHFSFITCTKLRACGRITCTKPLGERSGSILMSNFYDQDGSTIYFHSGTGKPAGPRAGCYLEGYPGDSTIRSISKQISNAVWIISKPFSAMTRNVPNWSANVPG